MILTANYAATGYGRVGYACRNASIISGNLSEAVTASDSETVIAGFIIPLSNGIVASDAALSLAFMGNSIAESVTSQDNVHPILSSMFSLSEQTVASDISLKNVTAALAFTSSLYACDSLLGSFYHHERLFAPKDEREGEVVGKEVEATRNLGVRKLTPREENRIFKS